MNYQLLIYIFTTDIVKGRNLYFSSAIVKEIPEYLLLTPILTPCGHRYENKCLNPAQTRIEYLKHIDAILCHLPATHATNGNSIGLYFALDFTSQGLDGLLMFGQCKISIALAQACSSLCCTIVFSSGKLPTQVKLLTLIDISKAVKSLAFIESLLGRKTTGCRGLIQL